VKIGDRCEVILSDVKREGTVMYIGEIEGMVGNWVGVQLDEPVGKNDGSVKGKRYFDCTDKFGCFVRSDKIKRKE